MTFPLFEGKLTLLKRRLVLREYCCCSSRSFSRTDTLDNKLSISLLCFSILWVSGSIHFKHVASILLPRLTATCFDIILDIWDKKCGSPSISATTRVRSQTVNLSRGGVLLKIFIPGTIRFGFIDRDNYIIRSWTTSVFPLSSLPFSLFLV